MDKEILRPTIKRFLSMLMTVGVIATAPTEYSRSIQTVNPELSIQKLADLSINRETRRKLVKKSGEEFAKIYHEFSKDFSQKFSNFSEALELFSSLLSDIVANDDLKDLISINDLTDLRDHIEKSIEQFVLLDKVLDKLEKLTKEKDKYQVRPLFQKIIEVEKQVLSFTDKLFYHKELEEIIDKRQEKALVFDETHSRDDIRHALFGVI